MIWAIILFFSYHLVGTSGQSFAKIAHTGYDSTEIIKTETPLDLPNLRNTSQKERKIISYVSSPSVESAEGRSMEMIALSRDESLSTAEKLHYLLRDEKLNYKISIKTGDQRGAGTDGIVEIIFGDGGDNHLFARLERKGKNDFEKGHVNDFNLESDITMSKICYMELTHFKRFFIPHRWFVDWVKITHLNFTKEFKIHQWSTRAFESDRFSFVANDCGNSFKAPHVESIFAATKVV